MEMEGRRLLAASQQQVWQALNDEKVLAGCIPGCEELERVADDRFELRMAVRIGPVAAKFKGKVTLADIQAPQGYTLSFEGSAGAAGFGKGISRVLLVPASGGCELAYTVEAQVGGKIAQIGQRLIDGVARSMADEFFQRFESEIERRHAAAGVTVPAAAPTSHTRGLPAWRLGWMWAGGTALLLAALVLLMI